MTCDILFVGDENISLTKKISVCAGIIKSDRRRYEPNF